MINRNGYVAVQHYSSNPWAVHFDDTTYHFVPQHNVSLAWIKEEHLNKILSITRKACCGTNPQRFHLASLINLNLWETGDRNRRV